MVNKMIDPSHKDDPVLDDVGQKTREEAAETREQTAAENDGEEQIDADNE